MQGALADQAGHSCLHSYRHADCIMMLVANRTHRLAREPLYMVDVAVLLGELVVQRVVTRRSSRRAVRLADVDPGHPDARRQEALKHPDFRTVTRPDVRQVRLKQRRGIPDPRDGARPPGAREGHDCEDGAAHQLEDLGGPAGAAPAPARAGARAGRGLRSLIMSCACRGRIAGGAAVRGIPAAAAAAAAAGQVAADAGEALHLGRQHAAAPALGLARAGPAPRSGH